MQPVVLDNIPFSLETADVLKALKINNIGDGEVDEDFLAVSAMVDTALQTGRPKAIYKMSFIDSKGEDHIIIDNIKLTSRILRINLDKANRAFPYIVTCGTELEEWSNSFQDMFAQYQASVIKQMVLASAITYTINRINLDFNPGKTSRMNPGSLENWPLSQQRELFSLLGDPYSAIGVKLTDSYLMIPVKSVSGIIFPAESGFQNCRLCPREICPGRCAPYDKTLLERYK